MTPTSNLPANPESAGASDCQRVQAAMRAQAEPEKAKFLAGFFKTGPGQYGEGDQFLGIVVPAVRQMAKQFRRLPLVDCETLLASPYNEERLLALLILAGRYQQGDVAIQDKVYQLYLAHRHRVNNWNLVDSSAPNIVGAHLLTRDRALLVELAQSRSLWDRRIAVLATLTFIRAKDFADTLRLVEMLLADPQDLMHKACGWMLRELGKRDAAVLEDFLSIHQQVMPRTMLRYAIERFAPDKRAALLAGTFRSAKSLPPTDSVHPCRS
ncbi:DNA alkylation repair protein [Rhodoferax sp.]|uniref:DNA alkylation repair protein n=1 Tax=Rhodoferax sp. TaxID=50421 RepID=UPI00284EDA8F|nr:DNA alkylation repair protein [Rhodoferax sp.]MDR3371496.1 DNA alkylation repair protein [Rhodoferax sp.]